MKLKIDLKEISNKNEKSKICNKILRALPDWFGLKNSIINYEKEVKETYFFSAFNGDESIGFVAVKKHNLFTAEIYVMGISKQYHRQGIGKKLITFCENYLKENSFVFLTVKTLDESAECENYKKTRQFYLTMGFRPLEVFPLLWNKDNPCLFMAKSLL